MTEPPPPPSPCPPSQLTLDEVFGNSGAAIVVLEGLRRWLELRPGLQLTLGTYRAFNGTLEAAVAISFVPYTVAPQGLQGSWAHLADPERSDWPLYRALTGAVHLFERTEREAHLERVWNAR